MIEMQKQSNVRNFRRNKLVYYLFIGYLALSIYESYISATVGVLSRYYILFLCASIFVTDFHFVNTRSVRLIAWWFLYYCITLFWTDSLALHAVTLYFFPIASMVTLFILGVGSSLRLRDVEKLLWFYQLFSFSLGILGLFFTKPMVEEMGTRLVLMLFGYQLDPNNLVALYGIGTGLALYHLQENIYKKLSICTLLVNGMLIFMTGSRSGIVLLAVQGIAAWLFVLKKGHVKIKISTLLIYGVGLAGILFLAFHYTPEKVLDRILGRGNLDFFDSTGRVARWQYGLSMWAEHCMFFGCGWGYFECHGTFFTFLVDTGLLGFCLFIGLTWYLFSQAWSKNLFHVFIILVSGIVPGIFIGAQNKRFFWNAFILAAMLIYKYTKENCNASYGKLDNPYSKLP